jgi:hypothetical protein
VIAYGATLDVPRGLVGSISSFRRRTGADRCRQKLAACGPVAEQQAIVTAGSWDRPGPFIGASTPV